MFKIVQVGLGPMGQRVVRDALKRGNFQFVGAIDPDPAKAGQDLGTLCGAKRLGVTVQPKLNAAKLRGAQAALLTTVSDLKRIAPQVEALARAGLDIVSTCEELVYPWQTAPTAAKALDAACRRYGVTCLSTGVNPGFLMDTLPCVLSGVCNRVEKIVVRRVQDASARRIPFQQKIGAGLTRAQFAAKRRTGTLRHVGLTESMHLIAAQMGWKLTRATESLAPVVAAKRVTSGYTPIAPGMARGVEQIGRAFVGKREVIRLEFRAAVGEPQSFDQVEIDGEPKINSTIAGGVNGDTATTAMVLNMLPRVLAAEPGLKTMRDLPPVAFHKA